MSYQQEYQASISDPESFWAEKAKLLSWYKQPEKILNVDEHGIHRWFADG